MQLDLSKTNSIEIAVSWIIIGCAVAWWLSRPRTKPNSTGPGWKFAISIWFKVFASVVFIGLPAGMLYFMLETPQPLGRLIVAMSVSCLCLALLVATFTTRIEITADGFRSHCLWRVTEYRFDEFNAVELYRFGYTLRRKDGRMNFAITVVYSKSSDLLDYVRKKIERCA